MPLPGEGILKKREAESENMPKVRRKSVKFNVDEDERTWQDDELKKMGSMIADLTTDNYKLKEKLDEKKYN